MLNLIINAIEAMSPHAAGARDLLIRTAKTKSGGALVTVRDSGPGVDPANLERIFDAFFSTKADGLGMGLSICRAIIQAHGGQLSATRGAARGTILQFSPYRRPRTAHRELALVGTSRACAIDCEIAAVHESVVGTSRHLAAPQRSAAIGGKRTSRGSCQKTSIYEYAAGLRWRLPINR